MFRLICCSLVLAAASGCVTRGVYDAEVARNRALRSDLEQRETRIGELRRQVLALEQSGKDLELSRAALTEERLALLDELEDVRSGNELIRDELERERTERALREAEIRQISDTYQSLIEELESEVSSGELEIERLQGRLQVRAQDEILFDSGSVQLKARGRRVLGRVAEQLRDLAEHTVQVVGHTDDVPIQTARFPSNWELSAARAAGVVRFLIEQGVAPGILSATGLGPERPIASNDDPTGRARNRRIEIVLVPKTGP